MDLTENRFKRALAEGRQQIGIWSTFRGGTCAELLGMAGFDWVLIDTEHAPLGVTDTLPALQAVAGTKASAAVRPAWNDTVLIKRHLDMGAQTLLIPFVQTGEEARAAVAATRYPPHGVRGVAGLHRASGYGMIEDYAARASEQICVLLQVETVTALENLEDIATTDGVDGVFIGPADLAASMGHLGQADHPDVQEKIGETIDRLVDLGVPAGLLATDPDAAQRWIDRGSSFTAVGLDMGLLARAATDLRNRFA